MSTRSVDVLVSSPDANFRALARTVLRAEGHDVVATSVAADRLPRQVLLRRPRVLLLDASAACPELRRCASAAGTQIVRVCEDRREESADGPAAISKWSPAALVASVDAVLTAGRRDTRLRLVES
jgi:CheY-like chemotaxis protein